MLTLFILSYTLGAVVTYGAIFAFFKKWENVGYIEDIITALFLGLGWPISIIFYLCMDGRKPFQSGLKFY